MPLNIPQLRKDFHAHIGEVQAYALPQTQPTLSLLTEEELQELEACWIALYLWKSQQVCSC